MYTQEARLAQAGHSRLFWMGLTQERWLQFHHLTDHGRDQPGGKGRPGSLGNIPVASEGEFPLKTPLPQWMRVWVKWRKTLGQQALQHTQVCLHHGLQGEDRGRSGSRPRAPCWNGRTRGRGVMGRARSGLEEAMSPFWVPSL